ncbi:hypothetical protein MUGA111182_06700 [Mucilaginibacter galii]|uniref:Uncharacterized protein n=1 Tax=Mucilaginibacter galii TaxID=2005073 RepID=A0A917JA46_9SPHI|nr:hypothetical protein [Mucilaginibacter galii]GGI51658.1 hypothetical protein GCM10011425_28700 [Mucilaginibacter galii]
MKAAKLIFLFLLTLSSSGELFAQKSAEASDVLAIRREYQKINAMPLTKKHYTYESSGCADGGVVDYFLNNRQIVKITESGAIGDGSWVNEYYYSNGKVIFIFETTVGGPAIGKITKTADRYYVKNDRPVRVMEGSKIVPVNSRAVEIIKTANKIYKAYITKDFVAALCN